MTGAADLSRRSFDPELMDTEQVSFEEFQHCLRVGSDQRSGDGEAVSPNLGGLVWL